MLLFRHRSKSVVFCFAALIACSALAQAKLQKDIEYGRAADVSLKLDASVPDGPGPFPAVIIVHGGGFTGGNKQMYVTPILEPLSRAGFAWFSIDYRLAPQYKFPAAVDCVIACKKQAMPASSIPSQAANTEWATGKAPRHTNRK